MCIRDRHQRSRRKDRAPRFAFHRLAEGGRAHRALLIAGSSTGLALLAAALVLLRNVRGRVLALGIGLAGPAGALMAFSTLERGARSGAIYGMVPVAGMMGIGIVMMGMRAREALSRRAVTPQ